MPFEMFQRIGNFFEQRAEYRAQALAALRRRENLPTSQRVKGDFYQREDGQFYPDPPGRQVWLDTTLYPNGKGGFAHWATGSRKQADLDNATRNWGSGHSAFEILDVAEDGRPLAAELVDLHRDAGTYEQAARVSHGEAGEQAPELVLDGTSDDEVESRLMEYLKRGPSNG